MNWLNVMTSLTALDYPYIACVIFARRWYTVRVARDSVNTLSLRSDSGVLMYKRVEELKAFGELNFRSLRERDG